MRKLSLLLVIVLLSNLIILKSQDKDIKKSLFTFGLVYNYTTIYQFPDFTVINKYKECNRLNYNHTVNNGFRAGIMGTIRVSDRLNFLISFLYSQSNIKLINDEILPANINDEITYLQTYNEISGTTSGLYSRLQLGYRVFNRLFLSAGFSFEHIVDLPVNKYYYSEISSEKHLQFTTQLSNTYDMKFFYFMPLIDISYDIVMGNKDFNIILTPDVSYEFGLYSLLDNNDWKYNVLTFGIMLRYSEGEY